MLRVENLRVAYGNVEVVHGISFHVDEGEVVTLLGANGAGKTTTLKAITGLVKATGGQIWFDGQPIAGLPGHVIKTMGISMCPEGRLVFPAMTVEENLELGAYVRRDAAAVREDIDRMYQQFPRLKERRQQLAGTLSGGEQQMLAIARALMSRPRLCILDEPSLGLAPLIVEEVAGIVRRINEGGTTILLVEQNARVALELSHRAYVLEVGQIVLAGNSRDLASDPMVVRAYLGE